MKSIAEERDAIAFNPVKLGFSARCAPRAQFV
jgi:hypothetical protein